MLKFHSLGVFQEVSSPLHAAEILGLPHISESAQEYARIKRVDGDSQFGVEVKNNGF